MTTNRPEEKRLSRFLDRVENLCKELDQLRSEHKEWKNKAESYILSIEELEEENEQLSKTVKELKLEFSDFAGKMEERLKSIRDEAMKLPVDNSDES